MKKGYFIKTGSINSINRNPGNVAYMGHIQTSFVLELVTLSCFGLKLHMMVIMKGLLSFYNRDLLTIHEAQNAKVLCVFENPAYFSFFFYNMPIFLITNTDHGGPRPRPRRVGARYGKIAIGLL